MQQADRQAGRRRKKGGEAQLDEHSGLGRVLIQVNCRWVIVVVSNCVCVGTDAVGASVRACGRLDELELEDEDEWNYNVSHLCEQSSAK